MSGPGKRVASTAYDLHIAQAERSLREYLGAVPTVMSTGDQDAADRAAEEMDAHLEAARAVRLAEEAE